MNWKSWDCSLPPAILLPHVLGMGQTSPSCHPTLVANKAATCQAPRAPEMCPMALWGCSAPQLPCPDRTLDSVRPTPPKAPQGFPGDMPRSWNLTAFPGAGSQAVRERWAHLKKERARTPVHPAVPLAHHPSLAGWSSHLAPQQGPLGRKRLHVSRRSCYWADGVRHGEIATSNLKGRGVLAGLPACSTTGWWAASLGA